MMFPISDVRRLFVGKIVGGIFGALIAGALLIPSFVPWYFAVLYTSSLRNVSLPELGYSPLFFVVALLFLYFEAIVLTALYFGLRSIYQFIRPATPSETAT